MKHILVLNNNGFPNDFLNVDDDARNHFDLESSF